nr:sporulation protein YqfD [uncultured Blautia sp.]
MVNLWKGFVWICISGGEQERFLNLCRARGIILEDLCFKDSGLCAMISVKDFFRLSSVRRKAKVHIHILKKQGMPFFFLRLKKRKAFFLGFFLCISILIFFSGRIWNIHVEGNVQNSTQQILEFLAEQNVRHGMSSRQVDCSALAAQIRKRFENMIWVSVRREGTQLLVSVKEGIPEEKQEKDQEPCSLASGLNGEIISMITRAGTPLVKPGDICEKGQILVLGQVELVNDSQEITGYEYVCADADIYIRHEIPYYEQFSMKNKQAVYTGERKKGFYIKAGSFFWMWANSLNQGYSRITEEKQVRLTENYVLPIAFGITRDEKYQIQTKVFTEKEAREKAILHMQQYERKLLKKGIEVEENKVKIKTDQETCTANGTFVVTEKTGVRVPAEKNMIPEKETDQ